YTHSNIDAIKSEVSYKSQDGTPHQITVEPSDMETVIGEEPLEGSMEYRTVFLPHRMPSIPFIQIISLYLQFQLLGYIVGLGFQRRLKIHNIHKQARRRR